MDLLARWNQSRWNQLNELEELRQRLGGLFIGWRVRRPQGRKKPVTVAQGAAGSEEIPRTGLSSCQGPEREVRVSFVKEASTTRAVFSVYTAGIEPLSHWGINE